ncbi:MAG: hypothetical protein RQ736_01585 [Thiogranum sp.]|nr:hypothetical protein [Thiogranum sp.]
MALTVQVLGGSTGDAIENASVCLGTSANPEQLGAKRTAIDGMARFDITLPDQVLITVAKPGFKGSRQLLQTGSPNQMLVLKLASGGGGPQCSAPATQSNRQDSGGLNIVDIDVAKPASTGTADHVLVSVAVEGKANQIRISGSADMSETEWQALRNPIAYQLDGSSGPREIYIQVRRYAQTEGANIEIISPVRSFRYFP